MPGTPVKNATKAIKVFCSYAHADEEWRQKLEMHLSLLIHEGTIELWYDRKIRPGTDWAREIDDHLNGAELILLLISSKFMNSYYCQGIEMKRALERHHAGIAYVVPILISSCDWETAPFAQLQVLPGGKFITEWSERDENAAFALVVKGLRQLIDSNLRLGPDGSLRKPAQHGSDKRAGQNNIPESQTQDNSQHLQARDNSQQQSWPLVWNVPFARNPFFTGREELLAQVSTQLRSSPGVALGQMQAISGLGGIGKTQLAIEYAYRQRQYYQAILWARADALDTLNASYSELATLLDLPQKNAEKQEIVVQAVKSWLETQRNWLLILDNLDEPGVLFPSIHNGQPRVLSPFLPDIPGGHLLITTRATDLASLGLGLAHPLPVETLSPQQGASLLLQRANLLTSSNTWETATSHGSKPVTSIRPGLTSLPRAPV